MSRSKDKPFLGILMLDTNFPRIIGDAGNIESYPYPARTKIIEGAGSLDIVKDGLPSDHLIEKFCVAAKELESDGAKAIVSTCGFLISVQDHISKAVKIPVMVSALSLYPEISKKPDGEMVGIITASQKSLGDMALKAAGIESVNVDNLANIEIVGMEDCTEFTNAFLKSKDEQSITLNENVIEQAVVEKAQLLLKNNPKISSFLLECGNLPPYAKAIEHGTSRPVYSILDAANRMMKR